MDAIQCSRLQQVRQLGNNVPVASPNTGTLASGSLAHQYQEKFSFEPIIVYGVNITILKTFSKKTQERVSKSSLYWTNLYMAQSRKKSLQ